MIPNTQERNTAPARQDFPDSVYWLKEIIRQLRQPGGCPWDAEQTHHSLLPHLLEEVYEVAEAIIEKNTPLLCEELGDILLHVVMHAELASEKDDFDLENIAAHAAEKLIRRHPHVFAKSDNAGVKTLDQISSQWEEIKKHEKKHALSTDEDAYLNNVNPHFPALTYAKELQKKAGKIGFDWPSAIGVFSKIEEEINEVKEALLEQEQGKGDQHLEEELGDLLFAVTNLTRKLGKDPETLLTQANHKFKNRFHAMEQHLHQKESSLENASLEEMQAIWQEMKKK